ncbi:MAG: hypothetical protein ACLFU8_09505 [Anaerolineales bacterium]
MDERSLGWVFVILGGLIFLAGVILGATIIGLQLFVGESAGDNLEGFLVVFGICALPFLLFGGVVLAFGGFVVWRNRKSADLPAEPNVDLSGFQAQPCLSSLYSPLIG